MERLYCTINEEQARIAHDMMSMSDYKVGSKTEEYRGYVDKAYDLAEKVAEARPRETDRVEALAKRYSKRMAEYIEPGEQLSVADVLRLCFGMLAIFQ